MKKSGAGKKSPAVKKTALRKTSSCDSSCAHSELVRFAPVCIIAADDGRKIVEFNPAASETFGYAADEVMGKDVGLLCSDSTDAVRVHESLLQTGRFSDNVVARRKDGSTFVTFLSAAELFDSSGERRGFECIVREVPGADSADESRRRAERFFDKIFESIKDPFSIVDRSFAIVKVNNAYAQMRGKSVEDLVGRKCHKVLQNLDSMCPDCIIGVTFDSGDPCAKDKLIVFPDGQKMWVEIYTYPIEDESGRVSHVIEYTRDITDRKMAEEEKRRLILKLEHLSTTDELTGLMNRRALIDRLGAETERASRYGSPLSLILCDIDRFKEINDTHGHAAGDSTIKTVSGILADSLRKSDMVGRYGGDEFMLILPETELNGAEEFAERLRAKVEKTPIRLLGGVSITMSLSIGITSMEEGNKDMDTLIKQADIALYASKQTGRNRVSVVK